MSESFLGSSSDTWRELSDRAQRTAEQLKQWRSEVKA